MRRTACFLMLLISVDAFAGFRDPSQADVVINDTVFTVQIKKDGTSERTIEVEQSAQNDQGRRELALGKIPYNPEEAVVTVLSAKTILPDGQEVPVNIKTIQEKDLANPAAGITRQREKIIPFMNVTMGARTKYKYKVKSKRTLIPGHFEDALVFGIRHFEKAGTYRFVSEVPLYVSSVNAEEWVRVENRKEGSSYVVEAKLIKPVYREVDEEALAIYSDKLVPRVFISTSRDWSVFTRFFGAKFEKILSAPLPASYKTIANTARAKVGLTEQINTVMEALSARMNYSGNWTSMDRMFIPQPLARIEKLQTGDCKDFATATVAILRSMGLKAHLALVMRDNEAKKLSSILGPGPGENPVPMMLHFNHAIAVVEAPNGEKVWIDPTNAIADAASHFPDIARSLALPIKPLAKAERIPESKLSSSVLSIERTYQLNHDSMIVGGTVSATGLTALGLRSAALMKGPVIVEKIFEQLVGTNAETSLRKFDPLDTVIRQARPVRTAFALKSNIPTRSTGEGSSFFIGMPPYLNTFLQTKPGRVTDLYVSDTGEFFNKTEIVGIDVVNESRYDCFITSSWAEFSRTVSPSTKGVVVTDLARNKVRQVSAIDLSSAAYKEFVDDIKRCAEYQEFPIKLREPGILAGKSIEEKATLAEAKRFASLGRLGIQTALSTARRMLVALAKQSAPTAETQTLFGEVTLQMGALGGGGYRVGFVEEADRFAQQALKLNPRFAEALVLLARCQAALGNLVGAKAQLAAVHQINPKTKEYNLAAAEVYLRDKNFDFAQRYASAAAAQAGDDKGELALAKLMQSRASFAATGKKDDAWPSFKAARDLVPESPLVIHQGALILWKTGQEKEASEIARKALTAREFSSISGALSEFTAVKRMPASKNP